MAKSVRSKRMKRLRSLKRVHYMKVQGDEKLQEVSNLQARTDPNRAFPYAKAPNKFLYPNDPEAEIPVHQDKKIIDFRSERVEGSGFVAVGVMRDPAKIAKGVGATIVTEEEEGHQEERKRAVKGKRGGDELAAMMDGMGLEEKAKRWEAKALRREERACFGGEKKVGKAVAKEKKRCVLSKKKQSNFKRRQYS